MIPLSGQLIMVLNDLIPVPDLLISYVGFAAVPNHSFHRFFDPRLQQIMQVHMEEINKMMLAKYSEILPELVKKSPELEIMQLSLKTPDGDFSGRAKIIVDGTNAAAVSNPLFLLSAVTAHADLTVTDRLLQRINASSHEKEIVTAIKQGKQEPLSDTEIKMLAAAKSEKRLEALVSKNILIYEDGKYKLTADYQKGQVTLNGRPLTLQDLLQQG